MAYLQGHNYINIRKHFKLLKTKYFLWISKVCLKMETTLITFLAE